MPASAWKSKRNLVRHMKCNYTERLRKQHDIVPVYDDNGRRVGWTPVLRTGKKGGK